MNYLCFLFNFTFPHQKSGSPASVEQSESSAKLRREYCRADELQGMLCPWNLLRLGGSLGPCGV